MSLRQQAAARREIRELREKLSTARTIAHAVQLTRWSGLGTRIVDQINTSARLGYVIEATTDDDVVVFTAVKRERVL